MGKDLGSEVENCSLKCESGTAIEGARIGQSEWELSSVYCPAGVRWLEGEADSGDAVDLSKLLGVVINELDLYKMSVCLAKDDS